MTANIIEKPQSKDEIETFKRRYPAILMFLLGIANTGYVAFSVHSRNHFGRVRIEVASGSLFNFYLFSILIGFEGHFGYLGPFIFGLQLSF